MAIIVNTLGELADEVDVFIANYQQEVVDIIFQELVDNSPIKTGTLQHNWRFDNTKTGRTGFVPNDGLERGPPDRRPMDVKYSKMWSNFSIYNNTPYINHVNDGNSGNEHNLGFIQRSIAQAVSKAGTGVIVV